MRHPEAMKAFEQRGKEILGGLTRHEADSLPLREWKDFDLRFAVEYPAYHFAAEVGFWALVMGLEFLSVDPTYVICTNAAHSFTFAFKPNDTEVDLSSLRLQWFTDGLDEVIADLKQRGAAYTLISHSPNQRIIRLHSPSGMPVEIWSGWEAGKTSE